MYCRKKKIGRKLSLIFECSFIDYVKYIAILLVFRPFLLYFKNNIYSNIYCRIFNLLFLMLLQVLRPIVRLGTWAYGRRALRGGISKRSWPVFTEVSEKTLGNSERLGRQTEPWIEPGTSCLAALSAELLCYRWSQQVSERIYVSWVIRGLKEKR